MRVETLNAETDLAVCVDVDGRRTDVLTALVPDVCPGDQLLVHAGTALLRLESSTEAPA
jgi:hydrogenase maturation factor